ncbi:MAG: hypothetical protein WCR34_05660 [Bacilli bacterium]
MEKGCVERIRTSLAVNTELLWLILTFGEINFIESGTDNSKLSAAERKIGQLQLELDLAKKKNELAAKLRRK